MWKILLWIFLILMMCFVLLCLYCCCKVAGESERRLHDSLIDSGKSRENPNKKKSEKI